MKFEDKLKEEMDDYCKFKCKGKGHIQDTVELDVACDECGERWEEKFDFSYAGCDTCQVSEFIRYIRDMK